MHSAFVQYARGEKHCSSVGYVYLVLYRSKLDLEAEIVLVFKKLRILLTAR